MQRPITTCSKEEEDSESDFELCDDISDDELSFVDEEETPTKGSALPFFTEDEPMCDERQE